MESISFTFPLHGAASMIIPLSNDVELLIQCFWSQKLLSVLTVFKIEDIIVGESILTISAFGQEMAP